MNPAGGGYIVAASCPSTSISSVTLVGLTAPSVLGAPVLPWHHQVQYGPPLFIVLKMYLTEETFL